MLLRKLSENLLLLRKRQSGAVPTVGSSSRGRCICFLPSNSFFFLLVSAPVALRSGQPDGNDKKSSANKLASGDRMRSINILAKVRGHDMHTHTHTHTRISNQSFNYPRMLIRCSKGSSIDESRIYLMYFDGDFSLTKLFFLFSVKLLKARYTCVDLPRTHDLPRTTECKLAVPS